jgi:hypothetical protein
MRHASGVFIPPIDHVTTSGWQDQAASRISSARGSGSPATSSAASEGSRAAMRRANSK